MTPHDRSGAPAQQSLAAETSTARYWRVRSDTTRLAAGLSAEDQLAQSMADSSPIKWHLGHTTWFFEQTVLGGACVGRDSAWDRLFNSYYESLGPRVARNERGLITRPSLEEVKAWRSRVDDAVAEMLDRPGALDDPRKAYLFELGVNHEQQHQELILADILNLFSKSPLSPAYASPPPPQRAAPVRPMGWRSFDGGQVRIGHARDGFAFDNEGPQHSILLAPYSLGDRLITSGEWLEFILDGGYRSPALWMSDGWAEVQKRGWTAPLYWSCENGAWTQMTLYGRMALDLDRPVSHVSWYEADAFARWAGARLPTEFEWEDGAAAVPVRGHLSRRDSGLMPETAGAARGLTQIYGDVWEWTASPYCPYPGFRPTPGVAGEYNGKFMANQFVLRGGSLATPADHIRASYRNFYYPHQRWQFAGVRLACDAGGPGPATRRRESAQTDEAKAFGAALIAGLTAHPKAVSPKWFYDQRGSDLFEQITGLDEYYLTRTETALLGEIGAEISDQIPNGAVLVEFGSGASSKTHILLHAAPQVNAYVPIDISPDALAAAAERIRAEHPQVEVSPLAADFTRGVRLPEPAASRPKIGFFPGSTIGNFTPAEAVAFLATAGRLLGDGSRLILGADLAKDPAVLLAAYDDGRGVTAAFNLNLLVRANRELGADFDLEAFQHRAIWNAEEGRVEMHLVSARDQQPTLGGVKFNFRRGESIHTENSYKFTPEMVEAIAAAAGWRTHKRWLSSEPTFGIFLFARGAG